MLKYTKFNQFKKLNSYDLMYKFVVTSIYTIPNISEISIRLNPQHALFTIQDEENVRNKILIKSWLTLFFINFSIPYTHAFYLKENEKLSVKQPSLYYSFLTDTKNHREMWKLLSLFFMEHDQIIIKSQSTLLNKKNFKNKSKLNFQVEINLKRFNYLAEIVDKLFTKMELQLLNLQLNFVVSTIYQENFPLKTIKNIYPLWNI